MRILLWGTYDTGKPRLRILREGLRRLGIVIEEIHFDPWKDIEDKSQIHGIGSKFFIGLRWFCAYPGLIWRLARAEKPDLVLISYPGIFDVFIAALIGRIRGIPVVWDVFLSLYDTIVEDRRLWRPSSLRARVLRRFERLALRLPDVIFMDTRTHAKRIESLFSLRQGCCAKVWVGAESSVFAPEARSDAAFDGAPLRVLFYGQFIPLHGIPVIVQAAQILREEQVEWTLIGRGQEESGVRAMLDANPLPKLNWIEWVTYGKLQQYIAASDVCLGIFGISEKAASVIPNKVFQIVAAGRPLITRDSDAIRELLRHAPPCTQLISPGDPDALAEAIMGFPNTKMRLAHAGCHQDLWNRINEVAIAGQFLTMIKARLPLNEQQVEH